MSVGDLNSGPHAYMANVQPTKPPQSKNGLLLTSGGVDRRTSFQHPSPAPPWLLLFGLLVGSFPVLAWIFFFFACGLDPSLR